MSWQNTPPQKTEHNFTWICSFFSSSRCPRCSFCSSKHLSLFKPLLISTFHYPCPCYIPHPFNIVFTHVFHPNAACSWQDSISMHLARVLQLSAGRYGDLSMCNHFWAKTTLWAESTRSELVSKRATTCLENISACFLRYYYCGFHR